MDQAIDGTNNGSNNNNNHLYVAADFNQPESVGNNA